MDKSINPVLTPKPSPVSEVISFTLKAPEKVGDMINKPVSEETVKASELPLRQYEGTARIIDIPFPQPKVEEETVKRDYVQMGNDLQGILDNTSKEDMLKYASSKVEEESEESEPDIWRRIVYECDPYETRTDWNKGISIKKFFELFKITRR